MTSQTAAATMSPEVPTTTTSMVEENKEKHAQQASSLQKKPQPNKIFREGSKLAQPSFAANAAYETLAFDSPEFKPFK